VRYTHFLCAKTIAVQVISSMRVMMTEDSNNAVSNSFLLDDDSRYNFNFSYIQQQHICFLNLNRHVLRSFCP